MSVQTEVLKDRKTGEPYICITGADLVSGRLKLPEQVDGLPVRSIGAHAFSGQQELKSVVLPASLYEIRSYAFYNCRNLTRITMTDAVEDLWDGVIRQCSSLETIEMTMQQGNYRLLLDLIGDTDAEISIRLHLPAGEAELVFPEYVNEAREDTYARAIHMSIVGSGYRYRQCLSRQGIGWKEYDRLFSWAAQIYSDTMLRIALARLHYPYQLEKEAEETYRNWIAVHAEEAMKSLLDAANADGIRTLLGITTPDAALMDAMLKRASKEKLTEIVGLLMDASGAQKKSGPETFSLDDLFVDL